MTISRATPRAQCALKELGVTASEEKLYRALLSQGDMTSAELARNAGSSVAALQRHISTLETKGLVTHSPEYVRRYSAVPPATAGNALLVYRRGELQRAYAAMTALEVAFNASSCDRRGGMRVVEILSPRAAQQMYLNFGRSLRKELWCMGGLSVLAPSPNDKPYDQLVEGIARGIKFRSITDTGLLHAPGALDYLRKAVTLGAGCRTFASLPFKFIIADRRMAIIPLDLSRPTGPILLVRRSSLLDALCAMFEMYWRAAPIFPAVDKGKNIPSGPSYLDGSIADLLGLLATGLNDKTIEHELGLSPRTLARRIDRLMKGLGAHTRFQAGWLAALAMQGRSSTTQK